jgi:predicted metal-binding protein
VVVFGQKAIKRAEMMKERGAEKIVFTSCIKRGAPSDIGYPCPFRAKMQKLIEEKVDIEVIGWTH